MRNRTALLVALAASSLSAGCDPAFWMHGTVRAQGVPVEGAEVTLACFQDRRVIGVTDARGRLVHHSIPGEAESCVITITKAGYAPRSLRLGDVCTSRFGVSCTAAELTADLTPAR